MTRKNKKSQQPPRILIFTALAVLGALIVVSVAISLSRDPAEDYWSEAKTLIVHGKAKEANALLRIIVSKYPESPYAERAMEILNPTELTKPVLEATVSRELSGVKNYRPSTPEDLYQEAQTFYPLGSKTRADLRQAKIRYIAIADSFPEDQLAPLSLYNAALCLDHIGTSAERVSLWKRLIDEYPNSGNVPEAYYALGFIYHKELGQRELGESYYRELIKRYPDANSSEAARHDPGIAGEYIESGSDKKNPAVEERPSIHTTPGGI